MEKICIGNVEVFAFENGECKWSFKGKEAINIHSRNLNDKMIKAYRSLINGDTTTYNGIKASILVDKKTFSEENIGLFVCVDDNFSIS